MEWYIDYFRDEHLRIVDPEGYALGLTVGFVLIPLVLIAAIVMIVVYFWPDSSEEEQPVHPFHDML